MPAHIAQTDIAAPADTVFDFMSDPERLSLWSFGTWHTTLHSDGLIEGRSLARGDPIWLRIAPHPEIGLIDYHLGSEPETLMPRIFARVTPGPVLDLPETHTALMLVALRGASMDDARWASLTRAHEAEIDLIKGLIESGHDHRRPPS